MEDLLVHTPSQKNNNTRKLFLKGRDEKVVYNNLLYNCIM
jgi:hypothetical protein